MQNLQDEDVGTVRVDHRFNDSWSGYFRFTRPDFTNFGPRLGIAWAPEKLHGNTVFRVGGGVYYGDGQVGNQLAFTYNGGDRFSLSQASNPGLAYPVNLIPNLGIGTAPGETDRYRRSEMSNQWTAQIQQRLPRGFTADQPYGNVEHSLIRRTGFPPASPKTVH